MSPGLSYTVWVSEAALNAILKEADKDPDRETGGVLMGHWAEHSAVIAAVIGPGPGAVSKKRRFRPDNQWQRQEIARLYRKSGRTVTYLGDWHSHPGRLPLPSRLDVRTAHRIATFEESRAPNPLIIIAGESLEHGRLLAVYRYDGRRLRTCKLIVY
ncbi:MAG: Mov34/MPN/PAD-1 family protein [Dehalococcoidia bacterium]|nr:Mov34/MPN/PAD-1 family protein [Dehalococcoidia bacterium]